eukprot:Clim_evm2s142 gene=Clim_evmTU2s142
MARKFQRLRTEEYDEDGSFEDLPLSTRPSMDRELLRSSVESSGRTRDLADMYDGVPIVVGRLRGSELLRRSVTLTNSETASQRPSTDFTSMPFSNGHGKSPAESGIYTLDEAIDYAGKGPGQFIYTSIIGAIWSVDAAEIMVLGYLGPALRCEWNLSPFATASLTTMIFIGMLLGSLVWSYVSDRIGRRRTIIYAVMVMAVAGMLSAFSPNYYALVVCRFVVGFAVGGLGQGVTLVAELLPTNGRGKIMTVMSVFWTVGSLGAAAMAVALMPEPGWRWLLGVSSLPAVAYVAVSFLIPESPRWLAHHHRIDEAEESIRKLAKLNKKELPENFQLHVDADEHESHHLSYFEKLCILFSPQWRKTTLLVLTVYFTLATCYYGVVLMTSELFAIESEGGSSACDASRVSATVTAVDDSPCDNLSTDDYVDVFITTVSEAPSILVTFIIIDNLGRVKSLALQLGGASLCMACLFFCLTRTWETVAIFGTRMFISGGFQVCTAYIPEVFPTNVRATSLGIKTASSRVGAIITPFIGEVLLRIHALAAIGIYASILAIACGCALMLPFETVGNALGTHAAKKGIEMQMMRRTSTSRAA